MPVWIDVLPHLCFIVAFAVWELVVNLAKPRNLIVIEIDAEAELVRNPHAAVHKPDASALDHFILFGLPRIVRIAGIGHMRSSGSGMRHRHQAHAQMIIGVHGNAHVERLAEVGQALQVSNAAPVMRV